MLNDIRELSAIKERFDQLFSGIINRNKTNLHGYVHAAWHDALELHELWCSLSEHLSYTTAELRNKQYLLYKVQNRTVRPIRNDLFLSTHAELQKAFKHLPNCKQRADRSCEEVSHILYSLQQAINALADIFSTPNKSRKRVGMWFEVLVAAILHHTGSIDLKNVSLSHKLVSAFDVGGKRHEANYEIDIAIFASSSRMLDRKAPYITFTVKTTTKDRLDKIFLDERIGRFVFETPPKTYGIFLHDVQLKLHKKKPPHVSSTFKAAHYLLFKHLFQSSVQMFYLDVPLEDESMAREIGIHPFSELLNKL